MTAGKEKLQPEAQICKLLSECNTSITCKEHTLDSVRSYTNSPPALAFIVKIAFYASRKQNESFTKISDQTSCFLEHNYLQMFQGPKQWLQSKYINKIKGSCM